MRIPTHLPLRWKNQAKSENDIKKVQALIETLDEKIAQVQELLSDESVSTDYEKLMQYTEELNSLQKEQEEAFTLWEELENSWFWGKYANKMCKFNCDLISVSLV